MGEWIELYTCLYRDRILLLPHFFEDERSNQLIGLFIFLSSENIKSEILLYVNSPGGSIVCGLSIVDTILFAGADVYTINVGKAFSIASFVFARGKRGKRHIFPHAHFIVRQLDSVSKGSSIEISFEMSEVSRLRLNIRNLYSRFTGQTVGRISADINRGEFLSSQQGCSYGLADVITKNLLSRY